MNTNSLDRKSRTHSHDQFQIYNIQDEKEARRPITKCTTDKVSLDKSVLRRIKKRLTMYESPLIQNISVEPTKLRRPDYPRKPTINDEEGEKPIDVAFKDWTRKMTFNSSRPESFVTGKRGTTGKKVKFITNSFSITSKESYNLYRYSVEFVPEQNNIDLQKELINKHSNVLGAYKFDGSTLVSVRDYNMDDFELFSMSNEPVPRRVVIKLSFITTIDTDDYEHQYLLKYFIRYSLETYQPSNDLTIVNYLPHQIYLQLQLEHWPGFEITVNTVDGGVLLGVKPFNIIVQMGTVLDFFNDCLKNYPLKYLEAFKDGVIGKTVISGHNKRTYVIYDVIESANLYTTLIPNKGNKITCSDFFQKIWNCKIKKHIQPILVSKKILNRTQVDFTEDTVFLVPELCRFTGITDAMRNDPEIMKITDSFYQVSRGTLMDTSNSFRKRIKNQLSHMEKMYGWNLKLENTLVEIFGRKLPDENIYSKKPNQIFKQLSGDWTASVTLCSLPMYQRSSVEKWVVLSPEIHDSVLHTFISRLMTTCSRFSFELPQPEVILMKDDGVDSYFNNLEKIVQGKPSFIFCVLTSTSIYNRVQQKLCVHYAVPSQVVLVKTLSNYQLWVYRKMAIQINCKLGGAPWLIDINKKGLMMVGLDMRCDKENNGALYAGLVATMNDTCTNYFSCVETPRNSNEEKWKSFSKSITKALTKYKEKNHALPTGIVIYKNVVENGQFSLIQKTDIELIKEACKQFYDEEPPLAFIAVHKQSNKVLFSCDSKMRDIGNPTSGTVIDNLITDRDSYDFYLASVPNYGPNSNCCKAPTYYKVLEDTLIDWSPDKMHHLTFQSTHMYYNKMCTIQVPAPVQLAQDLVFFAANTLKAAPNTGLEDILYFL